MIWKGFEKKWSWPNFKETVRNSPRGTEENHENFSHDSRSPGRDSNPGRPDYKAGMLTTKFGTLFQMAHALNAY
jgi:hypothetical protein